MEKSITITDINAAVVQRLKSELPGHTIYAAEVTEGFRRPCFFTQILMPTSSHETINLTYNRRIVIINYFSENGTELENMAMYSRLEQLFGMKLKVKDRLLTVQNIRGDIVDRVLQFKFDLNYYVEFKGKTDVYEIMQELEFNQRGEK